MSDISISTNVGPDLRSDPLISDFLTLHWHSHLVASRGKLTDASKIPRVTATQTDGKLVGLATFTLDSRAGECEVVSLNAAIQRSGIGRSLLQAVEAAAKAAGCHRVWLVASNTNPGAAVFYVKCGYRLVAVHLDAVTRSPQLKPEIPLVVDGVPMQDEWEFSKIL